MAKHVKWDVRTGGDGCWHVTRTEVDRSVKPDGTKVTRIHTDHISAGWERS